jgi:hypothetical protein
LRSFWQCQVSEIGYIFSTKVLASWVWAFSPGSFFWQSKFFAKSVFCKGYDKFSVLRFGKSVVFSKIKDGLVKNCGACKIKSVKGVVLFFRQRVF